MESAVNLWPLLGVGVIVIGFVLRFNPMLVVALAAIVTGLTASMPLMQIFTSNRHGLRQGNAYRPLIILLPLAVIGLLERHGLRGARAGVDLAHRLGHGWSRLLIVYLAVRELTACRGADQPGRASADGASVAGPDGRGRGRSRFGHLPEPVRQRVLAFAPPPTTSACSSARTSSWPSAPSC